MGSLYLVLCIWFLLVVNTSATDCLERLVHEMIYYLSRGTLNSTHSPCKKLLEKTLETWPDLSNCSRLGWFGLMLTVATVKAGHSHLCQVELHR